MGEECGGRTGVARPHGNRADPSEIDTAGVTAIYGS